MRSALVAIGVLVAARASGAPGEVVRVEHRDPAALPARGPATAPVTIELFFTPGPQSRTTAYRLLGQLQAAHPTRIRLVYRIVGGSGSARFPYAALEAQAEGKFFEFMDKFNDAFAKSRTGLDNQQLAELGKDVGLDAGRFEAAMKGPPEYKQVLEANDRRRRQRIRGGALPNALFNGKLPQTYLSSLGQQDLEREYLAAQDRAEELIDRGADPASLGAAFDQEPAGPSPDIAITPGATDEELDSVPTDPPLASPPLRLAGLPSFGPQKARVTIVVLCSPTSGNCGPTMRAAKTTQDVYPDAVRVVWAPFFDVMRDDAADLGMLGDAALCAEKVGTSSETDFESPSSPGWRWVTEVLSVATARRRHVPLDQLIDTVADRLGVDRKTFEACRARAAGDTVAWIEAAHHAGVRTTPSTMVGGRIYPPITDPTMLQLLVEEELEPGWLGASAPTWRAR